MESLLAEEKENFQEIKEHEVVKGTVVQVDHNEAYVDIGYKQEIPIPKNELVYPAPESAADVVKVGDELEVKVTEIDRQGRVNLSHKVLL